MLTGLVGFALAVLIWIGAVWDDLLALGNISRSYLPAAALLVVFLLGVAVNPLLRRYCPRLAPDQDQMVLLSAVVVMAGIVPAWTLVRQLPGLLVAACSSAADSQQVAEMYRELGLRSWLFPSALEYGVRGPVVDHFMDELPKGVPLPWGAWVRPMIAWGCLFAFGWMFMIGLAMIVYPQWRDNERVTFPIAFVYRSQIETPGKGHLFGPLFRDKWFWAGVGGVFCLYIFVGLNAYFPNRCPTFPLGWELSGAFSTVLRGRLPGQLTHGRIYFIFAGMAFLIPGRVGFSIWFFAVIYGVHEALVRVYFPPYVWQAPNDHRCGAMLAIAAWVLWIGRKHWLRVAQCAFGGIEAPGDRYNRTAVRLFLVGTVGVAGWLVWAGVPPWWALLLVFLGFLVCLVVSRIVAETGMPFLRLYSGSPIGVLAVFPFSWITPVTVYFSGIMDMFFNLGSRVNTTAFATQALAVESERKPDRRTRNSLVMLLVLVVGFLFYGALTVKTTYSRYSTLNDHWVLGEAGMDIHGIQNRLEQSKQDGCLLAPWARMNGKSVAFGAALAGVLQWGCVAIPRWPLHPIGLLMARQYYSNKAWPSMFLGWLMQVIVIRYLGARVYTRARNIAIGVIMGEVLAIVFWHAVASQLAILGLEYVSAVNGPG